jgi:hypothetical protein
MLGLSSPAAAKMSITRSEITALERICFMAENHQLTVLSQQLKELIRQDAAV